MGPSPNITWRHRHRHTRGGCIVTMKAESKELNYKTSNPLPRIAERPPKAGNMQRRIFLYSLHMYHNPAETLFQNSSLWIFGTIIFCLSHLVSGNFVSAALGN